jgi:hypothetical protein
MPDHVVSSSAPAAPAPDAQRFELPPSAVAKVIIPLEQRREQWGVGPWLDEPDRVDFEFAGLPCLLHRNIRTDGRYSPAAWCGYVAVPPGHPLHGLGYGSPEVDHAMRVRGVHGGLTYSEACAGHICHVPKPGEPDDVWWFGFDCNHSGDLAPGLAKGFGATGGAPESCRLTLPGDEYRDIAYVYAETIALAAQLAFAGAAT